ncbi:cytochrome c oxidase subunit 2A [Tumebacillus sp. ITR2]|uniref:Cytochrome c oxidase subunit 2A n=1 Tax=Tumebacillus amylolyticus TaxID=2801339 RepID=A0ABS1JEI1_9BACL|nr:cytochrome c oxidase subunit 2A [Tumebacillus amylolyticus]MBL0388686.1 cytochrome c oxidase subunit 2A [Tumebacillus amylolyticus]
MSQGSQQPPQEDEHGSLRGTFAAVMVLGFLILASWVGIFTLFLHRQ